MAQEVKNQTEEVALETMEEKGKFVEGESSPLPSPVVATTPKPKPKLSAAMIIPVWIVLSSSVIIYNNYLYNTLDFKYPVFTVTWHLTFAVRLYISTESLNN